MRRENSSSRIAKRVSSCSVGSPAYFPIQINRGCSSKSEAQKLCSRFCVNSRNQQSAKQKRCHNNCRKKNSCYEPAARTGTDDLSRKQHRSVNGEGGEHRHDNEKRANRIPRAYISTTCKHNCRHDQQRPNEAEIPTESKWFVDFLHCRMLPVTYTPRPPAPAS